MFDWGGSTQLSKFDSRREACSVAAEHARTSGPRDRAGTVQGMRAYREYHQARGHRVALAVEQQDATEHPHRSRETASSPRFREALSARKGERAHPIQGSRSARNERTGAGSQMHEHSLANSEFDPMEVGPLAEVDEGHSMTRCDAAESIGMQSRSLRRLNLGSLHSNRLTDFLAFPCRTLGVVETLRTGTDRGEYRASLVEQALCRFAFACLLWRR